MSVTASASKTLYTTGNPYEKQIGYHRAVKRGPFIFVSGTTAIHPETQQLQHPGNAYLQAKTAMMECVRAVESLGGKLEDVCRVRMFVARQEDCSMVGTAYREVFGSGVREEGMGSAATMVVLGRGGFIDGDMLVEVEVDAVVV
ncbi:hypothetical protein, variant [Cladophialophora immunda]|uniref:YjgF-like protein n=1 Tax=Cladophialophora immunda TaxID=569365 RepID=A0A0D2CJH2_9EURO|nr:uncharacterized protein PV07_02957 [Cladophialophora immunda]XP_016251514.1 hypothetical protein, variant [Cladophialophora immunda]KIW31297.1 hypothetical protein PV07_02957 [Cladophialophora immunda]KIW31298.1 hypothetical protein, variant [Cladophialophora immunda]OQV09122.1 hypothetical protein CLAIMM_13287 isoform 1 [Cladophialophora immunda]OQV09123.1 hypothetical protein CLAIMM_13287 isoform 2 [Cladophialophora immunda]